MSDHIREMKREKRNWMKEEKHNAQKFNLLRRDQKGSKTVISAATVIEIIKFDV